MELRLESHDLRDYLKEIPPVITWNTPGVKARINSIQSRSPDKREQARLAFELARDEISHSFDSGQPLVSVSAEDALSNGDGICFAKAHLLASLLRGMGIPCGFCYQRVTRKGTIESGHALHGLNAVYLDEVGWFRVDPRGNKPGIDSQFSMSEEKLAYPIRPELGEVDYPDVLVTPLPGVIEAMRSSCNTQELFYKRPESMTLG